MFHPQPGRQGDPVQLQVVLRAKSLQSCPTLCDSYGLQPARLLCPCYSPGKNTGVGCHALLQGIFPNQRSNLASLMSPTLAGGFFTTSAGKSKLQVRSCCSLHQNPQWLPSQIKKPLELSTRHPSSLVWSPPELFIPLWLHWAAGCSSEWSRCSPWHPDPAWLKANFSPPWSLLRGHLLSFENHSLSPNPTLDSLHPPDPIVSFSICEH